MRRSWFQGAGVRQGPAKRLRSARVTRSRARFGGYGALRSLGRVLALNVALVTLALSAAALPVAAASVSPLETTLLEQARRLELGRSRVWWRLLHYRKNEHGSPASQIDGQAFFLAPNGARDPEKELGATLHAFLEPVRAGYEDEHARCRFPARLRLLDEWLHFAAALPPIACPALSRFVHDLDPESVSVVYAANYLNNPASAFGHTFLRLQKRRAPGVTTPAEALDHSVEYAANTDTNNPVLYGFKGLTGLFPGVFRFHSFASKAHEYSNAEARDLWEYELNLSDSELELLTLHLWELSATHSDYYYMTKNCSYHVLATLEAAAPRLDLIDHLNFVVLPKDTVKAIVAKPGLVRGTRYRPSLRSQRRARVEPTPVPYDKAPERGVGSMRITLGSGVTSQYGSSFATLGYRLALHDLTDPPEGEPELSQVQFLDTRLRYDFGEQAFTLDRLTFAELVALNPLTQGEHALSWRVRAFGVRLHDRACRDCFAHGLELGLGATAATRDEHLALFLMADAYTAFSGSLDGIDGSFVRVGLGPYAGIRARLPGRCVGLATVNWAYLPAQHLHRTFDVRATLSSELGKDVAIGVEGAWQPSSFEAQLASYLYF